MSLILLTAIPHLPEFIFGIVMIVGPLVAVALIVVLWMRRKRNASESQAGSPSARL